MLEIAIHAFLKDNFAHKIIIVTTKLNSSQIRFLKERVNVSKAVNPPTALVQTWLDLIRSSESSEVRETAKEKLLGAFGNMKEVVEFVKVNGLK